MSTSKLQGSAFSSSKYRHHCVPGNSPIESSSAAQFDLEYNKEKKNFTKTNKKDFPCI